MHCLKINASAMIKEQCTLFTALCTIVHCIVHAISVATSAINVAGGIYLGLLKLWVIEGVINWTLKKMENNEREKDMRRV